MTVTTPPPSDAWLDDLALHPQQRASSGPIRAARRLADFAITTPGKMLAMMLVLTVAVGAIGFAQSQSMSKRQHALDVLVQTTEPMNHSAHVLLTSLSQADTVATTGFVQAGLMTPDEVKAYLASIDQAVIAASDIYEGASELTRPEDQERIQSLVRSIQRDLPLYVAFMERAKVNQRLGNPVGVSYMSEASSMMRERMITSANTLFALTQRQVAVEMVRLNAPQWVPLSGLVAALLLLAGAQWWLWRTFRRRWNKGFVAATAAMVVALAWVAGSNFISWRSGVIGFEQAAAPLRQLTDARLRAQETRTDETMALLRRQSVAESAESFESTYQGVSAALDTASDAPEVASARRALEQWSQAHGELVSTLDAGRFERAVDVLMVDSADHPSASTAYTELDANMVTLIESARAEMRNYIHTSLDATRLVSTVVALLSLLAVISMWFGVQRRFREYV